MGVMTTTHWQPITSHGSKVNSVHSIALLRQQSCTNSVDRCLLVDRPLTCREAEVKLKALVDKTTQAQKALNIELNEDEVEKETAIELPQMSLQRVFAEVTDVGMAVVGNIG